MCGVFGFGCLSVVHDSWKDRSESNDNFLSKLERFGGDRGSERGQGSVTSWEEDHVIAPHRKCLLQVDWRAD